MTATANRKAPVAKVAFKAAPAAKAAPEPAKTAAPARPRKAPAAQPEVIPVIDGHVRPTHHNGVAILKEHRITTPMGGYFRITRLELADDTEAFACWECTFTAKTRGEVMTHRNEDHGSRYLDTAARLRRQKQKDPEVLDLILPDREDGSRPPNRSADWTIGEIQAVVPTIQALGDHLEMQDRLIADLTEQLKGTRVSKSDQHKIDVYRANQEEIVELRAKVAKLGNYEEIKEELYELRAWKKKMITKLSSLGFQQSEED